MREADKWCSATLFILLGFFTIWFLGSGDIQCSVIGDVRNIMIGYIFPGRLHFSNNKVNDMKNKKPAPLNFAVGPNLSTCHGSFSRGGRPVNCCPPKRESEEPFVDFQFPNNSLPIRVRRSAHLVGDEYMAKYNKALSIMKSLPYEDPRNFLRQAHIHCIYCTGAYNQMHEELFLKIHRSWLFFPWHRMFLYFHERILGSLIEDDTFALPFWNWDNPEGMFIPDMYMSGAFFDGNREKSHLPPQVVDIDFVGTENGLGRKDQIENNLALMYHQMVSGAKKTELFMGCPLKAGEEGACDGPGTIESAPHNTVHTWVGSPENPERENLGAFYSAAKDPVFYAHHANIDRLWEVWKGLRGENAQIHDPDWLDSYFYFHDENSQNIRIKVRDVLDTTKLGYMYEPSDNPWLSARPKPSVPPRMARHILKMKGSNNEVQWVNQTLPPDFEPGGRMLDSITRIRVPLPMTSGTKKDKDEQEEIILVIYGIEFRRDAYVKLDVFVNAVEETKLVPKSREFAGTFVNMPPGVRVLRDKEDMVTMRKTNLKLGISELLADLEADGDEWIWVTLVPRSGGTCINITIGGVRTEYM